MVGVLVLLLVGFLHEMGLFGLVGLGGEGRGWFCTFGLSCWDVLLTCH